MSAFAYMLYVSLVLFKYGVGAYAAICTFVCQYEYVVGVSCFMLLAMCIVCGRLDLYVLVNEWSSPIIVSIS